MVWKPWHALERMQLTASEVEIAILLASSLKDCSLCKSSGSSWMSRSAVREGCSRRCTNGLTCTAGQAGKLADITMPVNQTCCWISTHLPLTGASAAGGHCALWSLVSWC